jgi:simple sugar transport system ATP-binding protein
LADVRLAVRNLATPGLLPSTFDVHGGEILGIAGVDGYGQIELAEALAGLRRANEGAIGLDT